MNKPALKSELEKAAFLPVKERLESLKPGENVLLDYGDAVKLLKYDGYEGQVLDGSKYRVGRQMYVEAVFDESVLDHLQKGTPLPPKSEFTDKRAVLNVFGTHMLNFDMDPEFGIYLPSSSGNDEYRELARKMMDGSIEVEEGSIGIFIGDTVIENKMKDVVRPGYFEDVIVPFLDGRPTKFQMPKWKKRLFGRKDLFDFIADFSKVADKLEHGDFIYVGCGEDVYLMGVAKGDDGKIYMQGTYNTSTKPPFYFANSYLGMMSRHEAEKPLAKHDARMINVCKYRVSSPPEFDGKPFIFPQMGRSQDCKNSIFTGEPEIITGDINEAIDHFEGTDFSEYMDIVRQYAETIDFVHPSFKPNGRYFF
jgi:hypothetical protein